MIKRLRKAKEEGNEAFKKGKYEEACSSYTEALEIDPDNKYINSKIYCNRATSQAKVGRSALLLLKMLYHVELLRYEFKMMYWYDLASLID